MKTRLPRRFWCALTLLSLMGQVAWVVENMYFNVFIYKMFNASAGDISAMVSASAVAATLTTVFIGALSDRLGKRKIFICSGYILWGISIFSFTLLRTEVISSLFPLAASAAAIGVSLTIILDCVMTFFGSTANDAAFNAWLTDSTDSTNRGAAEGINAMMPLVAILVVFGGFMAFDLNKAESWNTIFTVIGISTLLVGIIGIFIIKDPKALPSDTGYFKNIIYGFRPSTVKANPQLYKSLILFIIFNISIQIFMPYLILYYEVSLKMSNYVLVMAPAIIIASVVTVFWGRFYDKKGFLTSGVISLIALMCGYLILGLFSTTVPVFIGSLLMMCGYLSAMAVFGALIRDLTPKGKAGRLQGVRIFSQVLIPGIVGPFIGKTVLANADTVLNNDGTYSFIPNQNIFFAALGTAIIVFLLMLATNTQKKPRIVTLTTPFEKNVEKIPYNRHPRPQMERKDFICLNGEWSLSVQNKQGERDLGSILVPFPPQSKISGIYKSFDKKDTLIYRRVFTLPNTFSKDKLILHFDAVDQECTVLLNGIEIGIHIGGYLPFSFDITNAVKLGENNITVYVTDRTDTNIPYGKQRIKRGGMWYTPISGIWQTVWLEALPCEYIKDLKISSDTKSVTIKTTGGDKSKNITISTENGEKSYNYEGDSFTLMLDNPKCWSPEEPYLYRFTLKCGEDEIKSYFALRTVEVKAGGKFPHIALNGKPYFFNGLLDQGYFSDGIYMPSTEKGYENDIVTMKKLGFNMLRKHIKIEPDIFYYYCDKYGMIVFQDMVNSGKYSFLIDTALPTIGLKSGVRHYASKYRKQLFEASAKQTVKHLFNHPSICCYTIFNEGWGQYSDDTLYDELKSLDPTRIYDTASGWFKPRKSDFESVHTYFKPIKIKKAPSLPYFLSEFGGYSCKIRNHSFNLDKTYGYRKYEDINEFEDALKKLYLDEILPAVKNGLCAAVLTQVSDVEDETNGLMTYDRQIIKISADSLKPIFKEIYTAFIESQS